jgi:hypothetical protein
VADCYLQTADRWPLTRVAGSPRLCNTTLYANVSMSSPREPPRPEGCSGMRVWAGASRRAKWALKRGAHLARRDEIDLRGERRPIRVTEAAASASRSSPARTRIPEQPVRQPPSSAIGPELIDRRQKRCSFQPRGKPSCVAPAATHCATMSAPDRAPSVRGETRPVSRRWACVHTKRRTRCKQVTL